MSAPLRLEAEDPEVLARTGRALAASSRLKPRVLVRCSGDNGRCGTVLAAVGHTPHGPLFASSWRVPRRASVVIDGTQPLERIYQRHLRDTATEVTGEVDQDEVHSVCAILDADDVPDLVVRCREHGDTVLHREQVLHLLRIGKPWSVEVSFPTADYLEPTVDWTALGAPSVLRTSTQTIRYSWNPDMSTEDTLESGGTDSD